MTSTNPAAGVQAAKAFIDAFNAQDHDALADTLNYPHVRLAVGRFATVDNRAEFIERSRSGAASLVAEGWHHTVVASVEVVHCGPDKVHVAMTIERCHADGSVYNTFDTLWIASHVDGHWGIQFRSSFLR